MAATNASAPAVLALFNAANGTAYTYNDIIMEQIQVTTTAEANANGGANTKAWVRPITKLIPTMQNVGTWIYYNRIAMATIMPANATSVGFSGYRASDLVPTVFPNTYGTKPQYWDFQSNVVNVSSNTDISTTITAAAGSPAYTGSVAFKTNRSKGSYAIVPQEGARFNPSGIVSTPFTWQLLPAGPTQVTGTPTITGTLPPGVTMSWNSGVNQIVTFSGTPTTAGKYTVTLNVTFSGQAVTQQSLTIVIHPSGVANSGSWTNSAGAFVIGSSGSNNDKFTIANGQVATNSGYGQSVSTSVNLATKKSYFEYRVHRAAGPCNMELGVATVVPPGNAGLFSESASAWMLQQRSGEFRTGGVLKPGVFLNSGAGLFGPAFSPDQWMGFAVDATDMTAVKIWIAQNGSWMKDTAGNAGNPVTGAFPVITFNANGASVLYPAVGMQADASGQWASAMVTLYTSALDVITAAPTGFTCPFAN